LFDLLVEARVHHPRPPLAVTRIVGIARRLILAMHLVDLAPSMMKGEWWGVGGEFAVNNISGKEGVAGALE